MLAARPQDVFRAWTEPAQLERWCAPSGYKVLYIELDLRVGGAYSVVMKHPDETSVCVTGNFLAVAPGHRLAYTCARQGTEMDAGDTRVSVDLRDRSGSTGLVLTHRGFESDEVYDFHEWAWNSCLDQLADLL